MSNKIAVANFKRIWNIRKREMDITQVEAAEKLNWTQGAFSQYLNAITEMSPQTVIKLANFLDVNPLEIDPDIHDSLPNVDTKNVHYNLSNPNSKISGTVDYAIFDSSIQDFVVQVDKNCHLTVDDGLSRSWAVYKGMVLTCIDTLNPPSYIPRMSSNMPYYLCQKVNSDEFLIYSEQRLPPKKSLRKRFLLTDMTLY